MGSLGRMMGGTGLLFSAGGSWPENVARFTSGGRTLFTESPTRTELDLALGTGGFIIGGGRSRPTVLGGNGIRAGLRGAGGSATGSR